MGKQLAHAFGALLVASLSWLAGVAVAAADEAPPSARHAEASPRLLRGGWYLWDPYQYREVRHGVPVLTGLDVEIERALARVMGAEVVLADMPWEQHLAALAAGSADIAAGATYSVERARYAYFSKPDRHETDVLIVPRGASSRYTFQTIDEMLAQFAEQRFRLGVIAGYIYADARVNGFIADPAHGEQIVTASDDLQNLDKMAYLITK